MTNCRVSIHLCQEVKALDARASAFHDAAGRRVICITGVQFGAAIRDAILALGVYGQ
jgi:hypothetical protein